MFSCGLGNKSCLEKSLSLWNNLQGGKRRAESVGFVRLDFIKETKKKS